MSSGDLWLHLDKGGVTVKGVGFSGKDGAAIGGLPDLGLGVGDVEATAPGGELTPMTLVTGGGGEDVDEVIEVGGTNAAAEDGKNVGGMVDRAPREMPCGVKGGAAKGLA